MDSTNYLPTYDSIHEEALKRDSIAFLRRKAIIHLRALMAVRPISLSEIREVMRPYRLSDLIYTNWSDKSSVTDQLISLLSDGERDKVEVESHADLWFYFDSLAQLECKKEVC